MIKFGDYATLLDSFTRADEGPPMAGWSAWISSGLKVVSDQMAPNDSGDNGGYFSTPMSGPDVEAYITIATLPASGGQTQLSVRLDPSTGGDGTSYNVVHSPAAGTDTVTLQRVLAGAYTDLDSFSQELAAGDKLGIRCSGSLIEAWVYTGGRWLKLGSVTDTHIAGDGSDNKIGVYNYGNGGTGARYDDLYGGVIDIQPTVAAADSLSPTAASADSLAASAASADSLPLTVATPD